MKTNLLLSLFLLGVAGHRTIALAQSSGTFISTGSMITPRWNHTATLLHNGKVLIAGGIEVYPGGSSILASAELYDPVTGTFAPTGNMTTARSDHAATLLPDGRVLIAGGTTASAESYDPSTGTFTDLGNMSIVAPDCTTATLLRDGRVLIAGESNAVLYDPASGAFAAVGNYIGMDNCGDGLPVLTNLLPDGKVLFAGYYLPQLYDPVANTFSLAGTVAYLNYSASTLLTDGKVLFVGTDPYSGRSSSTELYDPASGTFTSTDDMAWRQVSPTTTLLPDGTVLIAGGYVCSGFECAFWGSQSSAQIYDPSTGIFTATSSMNAARSGHTATLLNDGRILIAGGGSQGGSYIFGANLSSAELYTPSMRIPAPVLFSLSGDGRGQGAIWDATTGQLASPSSPAVAGEILSMYTTSLFEGGVIPPQVAIGGKLAQILYFGDAPGYPGYFQVNFRVPGGVAPGPAVPVRLTYIGRPSNAVTIGVQ